LIGRKTTSDPCCQVFKSLIKGSSNDGEKELEKVGTTKTQYKTHSSLGPSWRIVVDTGMMYVLSISVK